MYCFFSKMYFFPEHVDFSLIDPFWTTDVTSTPIHPLQS